MITHNEIKHDNINQFILQISKKYNLYSYITHVKNEKTVLDLLDESLLLMTEYINDHILQIIHEDLYESIFEYSYEIMYNKYIEDNVLNTIINISNEECINVIYNINMISRSTIFKFVIPKRSYKKSYIRKNMSNKSYNKEINFHKITEKLNYLNSIIQPEQRSDEWYIFRSSTLTASNIWKIFISDYSQSQLILEKCQPVNIDRFKNININSPMHWGQKYEPVSALYYEYINKTKVSEFGCIPHKKYSFIAASPDGIICDTQSELYGRMLEIKNVVSREINGIPKMEYWIQMQIQMEVCELNECDFLETKFIEYECVDDYIDDISENYKGIILQFNKENTPHYEYAPFNISNKSHEYLNWEKDMFEKNKEIDFIKTIYWKLEKISNILVLRNKYWFNNILPLIKIFWENLMYEKETEKYKDRISKKRKAEILNDKAKSDFPKSGCLINNNLINTNKDLNTQETNGCLIDNNLFNTNKDNDIQGTSDLKFDTEIYK
tara:strand:- start:5537 stop:7024 length:1488 start_codon:yes stop_codon:yes gene_type:complete